jgi:hypothetical protein
MQVVKLIKLDIYSANIMQMLPPDERTIHKWSFGVYDLDDEDGFTEEDPTAFLISYGRMRFFQLTGAIICNLCFFYWLLML